MAPAPNPGPSATTAAASLAAVGIWRLLAVAAPHLAALGLMLQTEVDFSSRLGFLLSWGILNFFWIALLRRPALSGALSLTLVVVLVLLSRLKHDIVQMTANFVDLMVIDRDTVAFLFTIFPNLRWSAIGVAVLVIVSGVLSMKAVKFAAVMPVAFEGVRATEIEAVWPNVIDGAVMERLVVMEELTV